jgi:hypothetical protein
MAVTQGQLYEALAHDADNNVIIGEDGSPQKELVTVRPGLSVPVICQDFTFVAPPEKAGEDERVTVKTQRYVPGGVARYNVKKSAEDDGTMTDYVYYTTEGIMVPFVHADGTVREVQFGRPKDTGVVKRPFRDLGTHQKLGGVFDTAKTTLHTTGLTSYFFKPLEDVPGSSSRSGAVPYSTLIKNGREDALTSLTLLQTMGMASKDMTDAQVEEFVKTFIDGKVAARKAEIEAHNAKTKGPKIDPDTLTMETTKTA